MGCMRGWTLRKEKRTLRLRDQTGENVQQVSVIRNGNVLTNEESLLKN